MSGGGTAHRNVINSLLCFLVGVSFILGMDCQRKEIREMPPLYYVPRSLSLFTRAKPGFSNRRGTLFSLSGSLHNSLYSLTMDMPSIFRSQVTVLDTASVFSCDTASTVSDEEAPRVILTQKSPTVATRVSCFSYRSFQTHDGYAVAREAPHRGPLKRFGMESRVRRRSLGGG